jgi:hypothetical protein
MLLLITSNSSDPGLWWCLFTLSRKRVLIWYGFHSGQHSLPPLF